ncbi:transcriptional regulator, TetR family [Rhodopseudomonas palustris TIE-1]|uniref:TetR/AcrR family transcriptional regulator n=1 Tax=Rhodopseudomonas palustris TaxID=1076 RepID=UPI000164A5D1|nr:TetR/AcrR family transcriptional regulator [Rhodopseudomonas palustris]ACF00698.1 transcriptional regulator, TetR family [Rhodopseudomonas palustris TIE-1]
MVRVRTEAKRDAILDTAAEVFKERGLEGASMSEIASRLGGSKATLYGYFPSKEELFVHVALRVAGKQILGMYENLEARATDDPERVLTEFGKKLLHRVLVEDATTAHRLAVAHGRIGNLGRIFYDAGPGKAVEAFTRYIDAATKAGRLHAANPGAAAHHLLALLESEIAYRRRLQFDDAISASEIDQCVGRAVTVFLAAYAAPRTSDKAS